MALACERWPQRPAHGTIGGCEHPSRPHPRRRGRRRRRSATHRVLERNWFALRPFEVPVLPAGAEPGPGAAPVGHAPDPRTARLLSWIRSLDALDPDLVVNTGDSIAHPEAVQPLLDALGPLLDRPGMFVYGSNDLYSPIPANPLRYLWDTTREEAPAACSRPALGRARRGHGRGGLAGREQRPRPGQGRAASTSRWPGCTTRTSAATATRTSPGPPIPRPTCGSASCIRRSPGSWTGSSPTATTCCSPGTPTAARYACPGSGRWSPTAASTGPGQRPAPASRRGDRTGLAARVGRAGDLTVGAVPVRLPAGGNAAHAGSPDRLDCRGSRARTPGVHAVQAAGCGAAWQRASFGTKRPPVQIRPPRPSSQVDARPSHGIRALIV